MGVVLFWQPYKINIFLKQMRLFQAVLVKILDLKFVAKSPRLTLNEKCSHQWSTM